MKRKTHLYLNAAAITVDAFVLTLIPGSIIFALADKPHPSWIVLAGLLVFLLLVHCVFIAATHFWVPVLRKEWSVTIFGAFGAAHIYLEEMKYLRLLQKRKCKQNVASNAVVIVAYPDYSFLAGWVRSHWSFSEMVALLRLLEVREADFSFYTRANADDILDLMGNKKVKSVYFVGHGSRSAFGLSNGNVITYGDFDSRQHEKEYVHQVHCGHAEGETLIDRVVPESNRSKCFFFPEEIMNQKIVAELDKLTASETLARKAKTAS